MMTLGETKSLVEPLVYLFFLFENFIKIRIKPEKITIRMPALCITSARKRKEGEEERIVHLL